VKEVTAEVYALYEPGCDPWYVGLTTKDLASRFARHRKGGTDATRDLITPDTRIGVIEEVAGTRAECATSEQEWIDYGRDELGWPLVNADRGWPFTGRKHPLSAEATRRMADAGRATRGRKLSDDAKRRISEARKARVPWNKGVPMTEEQKVERRGRVPWNKGRSSASDDPGSHTGI
jgi:hypothetical protein